MPREVKAAIGGDIFSLQSPDAPLWYFVNQKAQGEVKGIYAKMSREMRLARSSIEIIALEEWIGKH